MPGVTPVKAVRFTKLRARIDALRRVAGLQAFSGTTVKGAVLRVGAVRSPQQRPDYAIDGWPDFVQTDQLRCPAEEHAAPFGVTTIRVQMTHVAVGQ